MTRRTLAPFDHEGQWVYSWGALSFLRRLVGKPRDLRDPHVFHQLSLVAFFAWVGLGADGLSSSSYGPEEAFTALGAHRYLAIFLAVAMAFTVFVISFTYTRVIERFPSGGGGYLVASKLLGEKAGLVSGSALLVDYVLTITISVASGANAVFALLPPWMAQWKLGFAICMLGVLIIMNMRGVKESVYILTPIFMVFLLTHAVLVIGSVGSHLGNVGTIASDVKTGLSNDLQTIGLWGVLLVFLRGYSLGGSAYTGIEAVANGLSIMREPRVLTGKRTMVLMATSLAITAGGILFAYLLLGIRPSQYPPSDPRYEPMNYFLAEAFAGTWTIGGIAIGKGVVILTVLSEALLLFVAAQTGFIDGPRVMSNMALDSWMPHQLAALSERLTMRNGVYLMGSAAVMAMLYTKGNVHMLAVMYSINVFLDFSLANLGMAKMTWGERNLGKSWKRNFGMHVLGLLLCSGILTVTVIEKFGHGGWLTLVVTAFVIALCWGVKAHYLMVAERLKKLNADLLPKVENVPDVTHQEVPEMDPTAPTAVLLAGGYGGIGLQTLTQMKKLFPGQFKQVLFLSVGVIDSGTFKGSSEIEALETSVRRQLDKYVNFARTKLGWAADSDMVIGTEAVAEIERLCREAHLRFPKSVFFAGNLIFREPTWWHRLLHNETAHAVQRRLEFDGLPMVVVPVRMLK